MAWEGKTETGRKIVHVTSTLPWASRPRSSEKGTTLIAFALQQRVLASSSNWSDAFTTLKVTRPYDWQPEIVVRQDFTYEQVCYSHASDQLFRLRYVNADPEKIRFVHVNMLTY
jgi:hypothetical protein